MSEVDFQVRVDRGGDSAVLELRGELDIATVPRLAQALSVLLDDEVTPVRHVVTDMSALTFADLSGMRPLLAARTVLERRGGSIEFAHPPYAARRILELVPVVPT